MSDKENAHYLINGKYRCRNDGECDVLVELKDRKKTITITLIEDKSRFKSGHIELLFRNSKKKVVLSKEKVNAHAFYTVGNDWFVIYPYRAGIPFAFELEEKESE